MLWKANYDNNNDNNNNNNNNKSNNKNNDPVISVNGIPKNQWMIQEHFHFTLPTFRVHGCRFENLPICLYLYKNNTLKISHS